MSHLLFIGVLALLIILVAHFGLKLYVFEDEHIENLKFENDLMNNNNNDNNDNNAHKQNLWKELTHNNDHTSHHPASYGPAGAKTTHAYQGKRGNFNGTVPNYPVLATKNEVSELHESLKKDLAGFLDEHSLDDHILEDKKYNERTQPLVNTPSIGPVIGRPTKQPYKEIPVGVEERTYDGKFKSYENVMYGSDINKYHKNNSVNPHTSAGKHYAPFDKPPILGY